MLVTGSGACVVGDVAPSRGDIAGPVEPSGVWNGPALADHAVKRVIAPQAPRVILGSSENVLNGHSSGLSLPPGCRF